MILVLFNLIPLPIIASFSIHNQSNVLSTFALPLKFLYRGGGYVASLDKMLMLKHEISHDLLIIHTIRFSTRPPTTIFETI